MNDHECIVCKNKFKNFIHHSLYKDNKKFVEYKVIGNDLDNYICPYCGSNDKLRHLLFFFNRLNLWDDFIEGKKILHINPEPYLSKLILSTKVQYISVNTFDFRVNKSISNIDITDMYFKDEYFDFIICNNVLQYVENDVKAMQELNRILKRGGRAIFQTPYSKKIKKSYKNITTVDKNKELKNYKFNNVVRIYGLDLFGKLKSAGFNLNIFKSRDIFTKEEAIYYGFDKRENLIMLLK